MACNFKISNEIALKMNKTFFEVILAKGFDKKALKILKKKKNMRIIDISKFQYESKIAVKFFDNSFLLQEKDNLIFNEKKLKFVTKNKTFKKRFKRYRICF